MDITDVSRTLKHFLDENGIRETPEVLLKFKNRDEEMRFKALILQQMQASLMAPVNTKMEGGIDFKCYGIKFHVISRWEQGIS